MTDINVTSTQGAGVSTPVVTEAVSRREDLRIPVPMQVMVGGVSYAAADWSLGGLRLIGADKALPEGERLVGALSIPFAGFTLQVKAGMSVVWRDLGRNELGCRFVDVRPEQLEVLRRVVTSYVSGQITNADGLLTTSGRHLARRAGAGAVDRPRLGRRVFGAVQRTIGYGVYTAVGVTLLVVAATALHARIFTVDAVIAAVTSPMREMAAPTTGWIAGGILPPGTVVEPGTVLATMRNDQLFAEREVAAAEVERERARKDAIAARMGDRDTFFAEYEKLARAELSRAQAELAAANTLVQTTGRQLSRASELSGKGFTSAQVLDTAKQSRAEAERSVLVARAKVVEAESNLRLAQRGYFYTGSRIEGSDPGALKGELAMTEQMVAVAEAKLAGFDRQLAALTIVSPCRCVVQDSLQHRGFVQQGQSIYLLREADTQTAQIRALVPQENVGRIAVGTQATVATADAGAEPRHGRVVAIERVPGLNQQYGLPEASVRDPKYAQVTIEPNDRRDLPEPGVPVQVSFPVQSLPSLVNGVSERLASLWEATGERVGTAIDQAWDAARAGTAKAAASIK